MVFGAHQRSASPTPGKSLVVHTRRSRQRASKPSPTSAEQPFEQADTLTKAGFEVAIAGVINALERDHAVIAITAKSARDGLEQFGRLPLAHPVHLQRCARRVDLDVLDVDVAEIIVFHLIMAVRICDLAAPAIVGGIPEHLEGILGIEVVDQFSCAVIGVDHGTVAGLNQ